MINPSDADGHQDTLLDTLTREFDVSALPWITADDDAAEPAQPNVPAPRKAPPPSPRSRKRADPEPTGDIVGGAAAVAGPSSRPRHAITIPKPPARPDPLPRVIAPQTEAAGVGQRYLGATLPPLERSAEPSGEVLGDRISRPVERRPRRVAIAGGLLALGLLGAGGVLFARRDVAARIAVPSTPAFLAAAVPPAMAPPPAPPPANDPRAPAAIEAAPATAPVASEGPGAASLASPPVAAAESASRPDSAPQVAAGESRPGSMPTASTSDVSKGAAGSPSPPAAVASSPAREQPVAKDLETKRAVGKRPSAHGQGPRSAPATTPQSLTPAERALTRSSEAQSSEAGPSASVNPITTYTYSAEELFRVAAAPKRMTELILQPGEKLVTCPTAGDSAFWVLHVVDAVQQDQPQQHVQVTPLRAGMTTNLTLTTTRRNYHLELTSSMAGPYMAAVQWRYPVDNAERRRQELARLTRERESTVSDVKGLRFAYVIRVVAGEPAWKPTTIFDDGVRTFIKFPAPVAAESAPLLFVLRSGGTKNAEYVNYRIRNDTYVVDRLLDNAELRLPTHGGEQQQIVSIRRSQS